MKVLAVCLFGLLGSCLGKGVLRGMFPDVPPMFQNGVDPGEPLFLTPYIDKGQYKEAREASRVGPIDGVSENHTSFAGFMTVNKTYNSNMFFWFWAAQSGMDDAPVVLWLQGGPGGSSLFGMFVENGPYEINADRQFIERATTWNKHYSMLYIDNPVGTGFSFTHNDAGYAKNEDDVARDLYSCLYQFFEMFEMIRENEFYATGESYAGKYVPAISYKIHMENQSPFTKIKINYMGMAIGDGLCDPESMMPQYADFMYQIGMLDTIQKNFFQGQALKAVQYIKDKNFYQAFQIFDMLLNGDLYPYKPYFYNVTHTENYYNFLLTEAPVEFEYYGKVLADPAIRKAIHVGSLTYNDGTEVEKHIINDIMDTVKPQVTAIMNNYKVMMYTGQLDIIVAIPLTEAFLLTVNWTQAEKYKSADRLVWKIKDSDPDVAGYVRQVDNFYQVIVRGGGHILPFDQPERSYDMITRFIEGRSFSNSKPRARDDTLYYTSG